MWTLVRWLKVWLKMLPLSFSLMQHNTAFDMLITVNLANIFRGKLSESMFRVYAVKTSGDGLLTPGDSNRSRMCLCINKYINYIN